MTSLFVRNAAIADRLHATNLSIKPGEMVAVIGPNGGGKTSLLRAIAGVEHATGEVEIGSEPLSSAHEARRRSLLAFLPATRDVHWPIPARDIVAMGANSPTDQAIDLVVDLLELGPLAERPMDRLSTGERTRVLLARCLVGKPALFLLDEPLANLDPYWVVRALEIMARETERGAIVLCALHDLGRLSGFSRALLMADGALQMDEAPTTLVGSERFEQIFRVRQGAAGWEIRS